MIIKKSQSYKKIKTQKDKELSSMSLDVATLDILCRYVLSNSAYLRMNHLVNLKKLIYGINPATYENDGEKIKRFTFLKRAISARLDNSISDLNLIMNYINSGIDFPIDFIDFNNLNMNVDDILYCHKLVSESIKYFFIYNESDDLIDICTQIKSSNYNNRGDLINRLDTTIDQIKNEFRIAKTDDDLTDMVFSLKQGAFESAVTETYNEVTNPSRRLICGMQGMNQMTGGGFESGRVYMYAGITGVGKSVTLLNIAYQIKRYNKGYIPKNPNKIPCIVILTMENGVVETITRLFDLATQGGGMGQYSLNEVLTKLRTEGELLLNDESPIDIIIKYKADKSADTSYLYEMADNLEDEGYELICLIQDHIMRIRSVFPSTDLRVELGNVVNEFKTFALKKDIPVISDCHLNRDAAKVIEDSGSKSIQTDITQKLGKSNVSESFLILNNADCSIILNKDYDDDNNEYMAFNLVKMRDKTDRTYIVQPFVYGSIRLAEDVGGIPLFKDSLHKNRDIQRMPSIRTTSANVMSNINNVINYNVNNDGMNNPGYYAFDDTKDSLDDEPPVEVKTPIKIIKPIFFESERQESISKDSLTSLLKDIESIHAKNA